MTSVQFSGIASGLDTGALVDALIKEYSVPKQRLQSQVAEQQTGIKALQGLNSSLQQLASAAEKLAGDDGLRLHAASTSDPSVTAAVGDKAGIGSLSFSVDRLATAQSSVSAAMSQWSDASGALTVVASDGTATELTAASTKPADIAWAINHSDVGLTATLVPAGTGAGDEPVYRLQVTSRQTGEAAAFSLYAGTAAQVDAGTATDVFAEPGAATVSSAQDARLTLWGGSAAEQQVTSATNTFEGLMTGVDVTVSAVSTAPVTVEVTQDDEAAAAKAKSLVGTLNSILSYLASNSSSKQTTDDDGKTTTQLGVFTADPMIRSLSRNLLEAATNPVDGFSPAKIGVQLHRDGTVTFDSATLTAALEEDPDTVGAMFGQLAGRIQEVAAKASDPYEGVVTRQVQAAQSQVSSLNGRISDWTDKIADYKRMLVGKFTAMESAISRMNTQLRFLQMQMASLSGGSAPAQSGSASGASAASSAQSINAS